MNIFYNSWCMIIIWHFWNIDYIQSYSFKNSTCVILFKSHKGCFELVKMQQIIITVTIMYSTYTLTDSMWLVSIQILICHYLLVVAILTSRNSVIFFLYVPAVLSAYWEHSYFSVYSVIFLFSPKYTICSFQTGGREYSSFCAQCVL